MKTTYIFFIKVVGIAGLEPALLAELRLKRSAASISPYAH